MALTRRSTFTALWISSALAAAIVAPPALLAGTTPEAQAPTRRSRRPATPPSTAPATTASAAATSTRPATTSGIEVSTAARAMQPGEVILFRITAPGRPSGISITGFDRTVTAERMDDGAWRALLGVDLDTKPGTYPVDITVTGADGPHTVIGDVTIRTKAFPTRRLKVNPALVEPPPEALERIKREGEKTTGIYRSPEAGSPLSVSTFVRPVAEPANSRFGSRSIFNGTRTSPHTGADFLSGTGTPIKAPNAGRVRLAENLYFSGNTVIVDHGLGLFSLFAHLSEFKVHEGDAVSQGDVVGLVGATGRVTGPHLHWALRANGARVDPLSLLAVLGPEAAKAEFTTLTVGDR